MCYTAFLFPPIQDPVQGKMLHLAAINLRHIALFYLLWYWHFRRIFVVVVQSLSCVWLFCDPMDCSMPCFPVLHNLAEFAQIHVQWASGAIQPSYPLLLPSPFALNLSQPQNLFKWVDSSYQVAKILELQLQHQSFQWEFRLISFRIDWFDLLAVQGTLKSVLQHHNLKASIFHFRWLEFLFKLQ